MNTEQFEFLHPICRIFRSLKFEIFLVGGCVRDAILGLPVKDFDLTTNARPESVKVILEMVGANVIDKNGGNFGTIACVFEGQEIEITTYRLDKKYETGSRRPEVEFADNLEDDLIRRDFTINAMTMDEFGDINYKSPMALRGYTDLKAGILSAPRNPDLMFEEDPLRILRMYRFAHRLRFVIKDDLRQAARKFAHHLVYISTERIHDEFMKIVGGNSADIAISEMVADGVAPFVLKGLVDMTDKDFKNAMEMVHCLSFWGQSKLVRLAAIFTMGYNDVKKDMNDLKFSNDDIKAVDTMVTAAVWAKELCRNKNAWDEAAVRLFIHTCKGFHHQTLCIMEASIRNSEKRFLDFPGYGPLTTEYAFMSQETIDFLINPKTALDGNEVKEILGIKDGPALGRVMKELKEMAISGHITTREEAEQWLTTK